MVFKEGSVVGHPMFGDALANVGMPPSSVNNEEYSIRQRNLFEKIPNKSAVLICANPVAIRSNDVHYPFRTNSDLLYLTGWVEEEAVLFAKKNEKGNVKTTLFVKPNDLEKEIWEGRRLGIDGAKEICPIDDAMPIESAEKYIKSEIKDVEEIFHQMNKNINIDEIVLSTISDRTRKRQKQGGGPMKITDPSNILSELRLRKSEKEIELIKHACEITASTHIEAIKFTRPNMGEWQLQGFIEGCFRFCGSAGWAYPSIVGSGDNATILHYKTNEDIMNSGDLVLVDAGAEYEGYAADITRTWPVNGKFTPEQEEIYNLVLESQKAAIDACVVGNPCNSHHIAASKVLKEGLVKLGIIDKDAKDLDAELKKYFMHGTGHWLGLDVHDVGTYEPDGDARVYESGMVITVEPGLYFAKWRDDLPDLDDKWKGIGVRIEDDVLITNNGPDVLTTMCPKEINEIESLMKLN